MLMCARCHERVAVVYITRIENNQTINEGVCLKCAKELGIKPVNDMIEKMGLSDEDMEKIDNEGMLSMLAPTDDSEDDEDCGRAPAIDFRKLFSNMLSDLPQKEGDPAKQDGQQKAGAAPKQIKQKGRRSLDQYCLDLTKRAREGKLDNIIGRDRELGRMIQILCRRQKNNPCLIGEPGVGKTAIAEALALRIAAGNVPYKLKNKEIHLVDLTALVAGTQFRGQFESRMKGLIAEVKSLGNIILVIDEVHSIVGAGDAEGSMNAANILKPALSRGEIQVIGATTLTEYRKYIEKDSALERRFQPIIVEEPSIEDTTKILLGIKHYYELYHGIKIPDETVRRAVILSERYITDRFLPDKAIDLLDEASSYLALHAPVIEQIEAIKATVENTRRERETLEAQLESGEVPDESIYQRIADLKVRELKDMNTFGALSRERDGIVLTTAELAEVIEIWTGVPASDITEDEFIRIDKLESRLKARIVGQDEAVSAVARAIKRSRAGVAYKRRPVSFIFAGPTGVGKTELVRTLANELFNSPETLIRLDMSEFMEKHSVSRMVGSPPGYVGYDEAGQLTEKIRRKPYSVVLFDEIEKAHPDVLNVLLQILDDGRITDAQGRVINFENTVIVMTTNAGSNLALAPAGFGITEKASGETRTEKALSEFLRPEFINRVDEIITFRSLDENDFTSIAEIMLGDLAKALAEKEISFTCTPAASQFIAKNSFSRKFGARNMRRYIQRTLEDEIANRIIGSYGKKITAILVDCTEGKENLNIQCEMS